MKYTEVSTSCNSGEEFFGSFALKKGDNKVKQYRAPARASVARNLAGALLLLKGTLK